MSLNQAVREREALRQAGKTVVLTNGCFDLLHPGHARYLQEARALGDCLMVGVNSDDSVRELKGPGRPVMPVAARAELLAALACVDFVNPFEETTAERLVRALKPEVYAKGGDYVANDLPEAKAVAEVGGRTVILPLSTVYSTTAIIQRIREGRGPQPQ